MSFDYKLVELNGRYQPAPIIVLIRQMGNAPAGKRKQNAALAKCANCAKDLEVSLTVAEASLQTACRALKRYLRAVRAILR